MRLTDDEIVWIYEQARRHSILFSGRVYADQSSNNVLHAWQGLERQFKIVIYTHGNTIEFSRNGARTLRRYLINTIDILKNSIIPGYEKRLDLPDGSRYLKYIQSADTKLKTLLEPLLKKIEREF